MSRQQGLPYLIKDGMFHELERANNPFNEEWLQKFLFDHPQTIPVDQIEPAFGPLIPVCREMQTSAGPIDALFINKLGLLTVVECKLWKNPEARRTVVAQILDYAKELSQWKFSDLEKAISRASLKKDSSLYHLLSENAEEIAERDFVDSVSRNLERGRFLLLIIGDGIRESVEQIADFLQEYGHLNFGLALVEFGVFKLTDDKGKDYLIQPRVLAQTVEIEKAVFRIEEGQIKAVISTDHDVTLHSKRTKISEQVFFESLETDDTTKNQLKAFFEDIQNIGIDADPGDNSMILRSRSNDANLGVFRVSGGFINRGIASMTRDLGKPQIGENYLTQLARLLPNGIVRKGDNLFTWTVQIKESKRERNATIAEMMAIKDKWLKLIQETLDKLSELEAQ